MLFYSDGLKEHRGHIPSMLEPLSKAKIHLKMKKCKFHKQEIKYLRLIVEKNGVEMDQEKVRAVNDSEPPEWTFDVGSFVGFANFY